MLGNFDDFRRSASLENAQTRAVSPSINCIKFNKICWWPQSSLHSSWWPFLKSAQADAKFADADLSTKLKLLGVDVASFGGSSDFWFKRQYSSSGPRSLGATCYGVVNYRKVKPSRPKIRRLLYSCDVKCSSRIRHGIEQVAEVIPLEGTWNGLSPLRTSCRFREIFWKGVFFDHVFGPKKGMSSDYTILHNIIPMNFSGQNVTPSFFLRVEWCKEGVPHSTFSSSGWSQHLIVQEKKSCPRSVRCRGGYRSWCLTRQGPTLPPSFWGSETTKFPGQNHLTSIPPEKSRILPN